jgi:hypothetical protein
LILILFAILTLICIWACNKARHYFESTSIGNAICSNLYAWFCKQFTLFLAFLDGVDVDGRPNATIGPCDGTFKFA